MIKRTVCCRQKPPADYSSIGGSTPISVGRYSRRFQPDLCWQIGEQTFIQVSTIRQWPTGLISIPLVESAWCNPWPDAEGPTPIGKTNEAILTSQRSPPDTSTSLVQMAFLNLPPWVCSREGKPQCLT